MTGMSTSHWQTNSPRPQSEGNVPPLTFTVLTLFPELFIPFTAYSLVGRAIRNNLVRVSLIPLRQYGIGKYQAVDDRPYGGGKGMILRVDVIHRALIDLRRTIGTDFRTILLDPAGETLTQGKVRALSSCRNIVLIAGHYEGVDARVKTYVDESLSTGDYILAGGELPAMTVIESVTRLIPGVLPDETVTENETFSLTDPDNPDSVLLEYPQFTRPPDYDGQPVPEVLLSGNHSEIASYRKTHTGVRPKR